MRPRPCCACAALITDLKQRGLLDETLVIWGGEFGRTPMNEARGGSTFLGRDHHPAVFSCVLAGAGVRGGVVHGASDERGFSPESGTVSVADFNSTVAAFLQKPFVKIDRIGDTMKSLEKMRAETAK